jgi:hypothetical protein
MFKMKTIMILMSIMKLSQLIKTHQINKYSIHTFEVDYQDIPIYFNFLCPYEFSSTR